ncbi:MAG: TatD family hydrolase [Vicinamibacteria bacterium]|nr:TatD family hydrolase [Vicinamibacteria bacterium]
MIDSHCHIDSREFDADRDAVIERARAAGVETMLVVGVMDGRGGHESALNVSRRHGLPVAVGIHPHEARFADEAAYEELARLAHEKRIVAVGEIGLDYHYDHSPRDAQREAFRRQLRLAQSVGLPVIIHTREADGETITILTEENVGASGGVLHCFSGGESLARRALDLGLYISFSGIVAFPKACEIREVARWVPEDRLLIETDAPYLAPPPYRGKRNEPAFVVEVARTLAEARKETFFNIAQATTVAFQRLFA